MSSLNCVKCHTGLVIPTNPTGDRFRSAWKCQKCSHNYHGPMIASAIQQSQYYAEDVNRTDVREVEKAVKKLGITLSKEHMIILDLKQCLIGLHSEVIRREPNPARKSLNRKLELCKDILPVLKKVEPGISRLHGITTN